MEKLFASIGSAIASVFGLMNEKQCNLKHEAVEVQQNALCDKLENLHDDVREIRDIVIEHLVNKK